jgi:hypothetical protein
MSPQLVGSETGETRSIIVAKITAKAVKYFETECVRVKIVTEKQHPMLSLVNVEYVAVVWHDLDSRTYGPDRCRACDKSSWPHAPLNATKAPVFE